MNEAPLPARPSRLNAELALKILAVLAVIYTFYFCRSLLLPIILAAFIALFASPAVRFLARLKFPKPLASLLILTLIVMGVGYGISLLYSPASAWLERLPLLSSKLALQVDDMAGSLDSLKSSMLPDNEDDKSPFDSALGSGFLPLISMLAQTTAMMLFQLATVIILTYLFLVFGGTLLRNIVRGASTLHEKKNLVKMYQTIEHDISRYVLVIAVINTMLGVATFAVLSMLGVADPLLWGVLATVLNFAPYLGPFILTVLLTAVGFVEFQSPGQALLVPTAFLILNVIESQLVTPMALGKRFNMNPLLVVIWMFVWGWIWGAVGVLIAIPLLVCLKIIASHFELLPYWRILLSADSEAQHNK
ncbi:Predicted PurR-regulated permease PerM [Arsukibacterium tuosuense]|uniref:Predicted PurR-regulated permease PerM n=1 Tax=Arsukibacterium tuosuense TaxID=1323745 RepID=A0A285J6J8_9GAMM|nr:AI-2E family transporter [Arsukibacterium tuosuense]SNY54721.1 Predicted PurR-regulated permease PerM [Arsukibacterium tuosuense]